MPNRLQMTAQNLNGLPETLPGTAVAITPSMLGPVDDMAKRQSKFGALQCQHGGLPHRALRRPRNIDGDRTAVIACASRCTAAGACQSRYDMSHVQCTAASGENTSPPAPPPGAFVAPYPGTVYVPTASYVPPPSVAHEIRHRRRGSERFSQSW